MGTSVVVNIGYGFKVPKSVVERLDHEGDGEGAYERLEQILEPYSKVLTFDMAYYHDYSDEDPYAILVKRLTDSFTGTHVHDGPVQSIPNALTQPEIDALINVWRDLGIQPEDLSMRWLTIVAVG